MPPRINLRAVSFEGLMPFSRPAVRSHPLRTLPMRMTPLSAPRPFTTTPIFEKKGKNNAPRDSQKTGTKASPQEYDASDFTMLHEGIAKSLVRLDEDLSKLRTGGRFNPELLESVRVSLDKESKETFKISELAQVLPKGGRSLMILVGEHDHVKHITSAIQLSDLNLQPVQDPHNANQLNVPLPPPTKESRDAAQAAAHAAGTKAITGITNTRGVMQKHLRKMEIEKLALPDELKRAHKEMEKIVKEGTEKAKNVVKVAQKAMEQA